MGKLQIIAGGQFGSEAKGTVAARLAAEDDSVMCVRVAGPNAGHTVYDDNGKPWPLRQVPVGAVSQPDSPLIIAAGSEIDLEVLRSEVVALDEAGFEVSDRLAVDAQATIIEPVAHDEELDLVSRIGSTGKGIGAARASRIMRSAKVWGDLSDRETFGLDDHYTIGHMEHHLAHGGTVQIEGTQGYGLGLHAGFYPYCTSSDCRAIDFMAMTGLSMWNEYVTDLEVWVVFRAYPIRVAGTSGPLENERTWESLGLPEERTTVTKKVRRVGLWDGALAQAALRANGCPSPWVKTALMMADQVHPDLYGETDARKAFEVMQRHPYFRQILSDLGAYPSLLGTGPRSQVDFRSMVSPGSMGSGIN